MGVGEGDGDGVQEHLAWDRSFGVAWVGDSGLSDRARRWPAKLRWRTLLLPRAAATGQVASSVKNLTCWIRLFSREGRLNSSEK